MEVDAEVSNGRGFEDPSRSHPRPWAGGIDPEIYVFSHDYPYLDDLAACASNTVTTALVTPTAVGNSSISSIACAFDWGPSTPVATNCTPG